MLEIHESLIGLMQEIDDIAQKNGVEYYLFGGTLIGAMRHKGFIPWDDDVDIIMSRDNWEKFLAACKEGLPENRTLSSQDLNPDIAMPVHHYVDTRGTTLYRYHITNPEVSGMMIDIQVMDPVPDTKEAHDAYIDDVLDLQDFTNGTYYVALRNPAHPGRASQIAKYREMNRHRSKREVIDEIGKRSFHYSVEESAYYAQRYGGAPIFYPIEAFGKPRYVPFENVMLPVPERAADVLTIAYGDWWMIPRSGSTRSSHDFAVRSNTTPSDVFLKEFQSVTSQKKIEKIAWDKKLLQEKLTKERFISATNVDVFLQQKVCMAYEKKSGEFDAVAALGEGRYEDLKAYFEEYISAQCNEHYTGSPSINGWKRFFRRNAPLLIDIGDDQLAAAILLQIHENRLNSATKMVNARKTIDREVTGLLAKALAVYNGTMKAISHDACGESEQCCAMLPDLLAQFPDNPYVFVLQKKQEIAKGASPEAVIEAADEGLERFADNDDLLFFKAEALLQRNETAAAFEIYETLSRISNNGVVLTAVKEKLASMREDVPEAVTMWLKIRLQLGEELDAKSLALLHEKAVSAEGDLYDELADDADFTEEKTEESAGEDFEEEPAALIGRTEELTDIQKVRLDLLFEIDEICRAEGIRYMLMSAALYQAVRYGSYVFPESEIIVGMSVPDAKRFSEAVAKRNRPDRFLDSMETNPDYPLFNMLYGDENSLDFNVIRCGEKTKFGIYVTISVIRTAYKNKLSGRTDAVLEKGWQNQYSLKDAAFFEHKSDYVIDFMRVFYGQKLGGHLYKRLMRRGWNDDAEQLFVKFYKKKRSYFPAVFYEDLSEVDFEGRKIMAPAQPDYFLEKWYKNPENLDQKLGGQKPNQHNRIVDANVPYAQYLDYLKAHGVNWQKIWKYNVEANAKYAKVLVLDRKLKKYWNLLCSIGYHHNLSEKYLPMKEELRELLEKKDIATLSEVMAEYDEAYRNKAITRSYLEFDPELTEIYLELKAIQKEQKRAEALERKIKKMDMERLTQDRLEEVLSYLRKDIPNCLYMYIDIAKYGIDNENIAVWFDTDEDGQINTVIMKYYNSISIYSSRDEYDVEKIVKVIELLNVSTINAKKAIIKAIEPELAEKYTAEYGYVFRFDASKEIDCKDEIETAALSDMHEIAELICADSDFGAMYNVDNLAQQLGDRMQSNFGRSYIVRHDGRIIAHIASYAEYDHIATTSGLVVAKEYQNGVYGMALENYLVNRLWEDDFVVYTFIVKKLRKRLLEVTGNTQVGEYGKLTVKPVDEEN